jgi:hypothetical protein
LRGSVDAVPVSVTEISISGAKVLHESRFPERPGRVHQLWFDWNEHTLRFEVAVARTTLMTLAKRPGDKSHYGSGLRFIAPEEGTDPILRELIAFYVTRAINEQIANANGLPPLDGYPFQVGKGSRYRRCEYNGTWRRSETTDPTQPQNGFTISAEVDPMQVEMLCGTWLVLDAEGRRLTQMLAQLSINPNEGTATRRYMP